jgi:hypothetical protein
LGGVVLIGERSVSGEFAQHQPARRAALWNEQGNTSLGSAGMLTGSRQVVPVHSLPLVCMFTPFPLKKRLLDFTVNAHQPVLRSSGALTKVIGLGLKLVRFLLSITQPEAAKSTLDDLSEDNNPQRERRWAIHFVVGIKGRSSFSRARKAVIRAEVRRRIGLFPGYSSGK